MRLIVLWSLHFAATRRSWLQICRSYKYTQSGIHQLPPIADIIDLIWTFSRSKSNILFPLYLPVAQSALLLDYELGDRGIAVWF
jgi:hypothetical protein